ncbi:MAG TPA: methyltransferase domain-containing protein [Candidatus Wujingus californicus]|uniref:methyltransferase domain-containing protein n=1 Tax=Candidatus Wujingus californicus TaxID=3367618 RepID=UPI001DAB92D3|nr:methyltransferase domain-containing protein [Planctomycetota bacterium]MDO8132480.1 methyltransferase domain-containing protein [Candidatus Brocadiales bacterium]
MIKFSSQNIKPFIKQLLESVYIKSLKKAAKEQGLNTLVNRLEALVPDVTNQYSTRKIDTNYLRTKIRGLHAFQIALVNEVISGFENPVIVDIGDSAGTHLQYLMGLYLNIKCLSVNLDKDAIERIRGKGINAIHARAEDLDQYNIDVDVFLCFQVLEHMMNPCMFLHNLSEKTNAKFLVVTVPYVRKSRVALNYIRRNMNEIVKAENTHIFELSPEDWKLIVRHSGWNIVKERIYSQYPRREFLRITKALWKRFDYEGFYGMILTRNDAWSSKYMDW